MTAPLRIALAGLGTVGVGVVRILQNHGPLLAARAGRPLELVAISARSRSKDRGVDLGGYGWEERGPYDGILATAAPERVPEELLRQLDPGGRLVIPVGGDTQHLQVVTRSAEGYDTEIVEAVNFVPLRPGTVR